MIDTTRSLRIISPAPSSPSHGPAEKLAVTDRYVVVRTGRGEVLAFELSTGRVAPGYTRSALRLENEPIRTTTRFYARKSASLPGQIKLQQVRPVSSIGEIEVDIENDKIVAVRLA